MYYLYHIPGKKIGLTKNLNERVTKQQGYKLGEYELLEATEDISYASKKNQNYKNFMDIKQIINYMKI